MTSAVFNGYCANDNRYDSDGGGVIKKKREKKEKKIPQIFLLPAESFVILHKIAVMKAVHV